MNLGFMVDLRFLEQFKWH